MFIIKGGYHLNYINVLIRGNVNIRSIVLQNRFTKITNVYANAKWIVGGDQNSIFL